MTEISAIMDQLPVYTRTGTFVGHTRNAILDTENRTVEALLVTRTNPDIVEDGMDVAIPYRWVADFNDILVLRHFPDVVSREDQVQTEQADGEEFIEVTA